MPTIVELPSSPLPDLQVIDLLDGGEPVLQSFFEANPLYFEAVHGIPAEPGEAHEEIHGELPSGYAFTHKYVFGYEAAESRLAAMANVVSDLLAPGIWHVGTFIVETRRHGSGDAQTLYRSIEAWARQHGARWLRLGVVAGHSRAEAFWQGRGYVEVARREGIVMGQQTNAVRVMVKPLYGQTLADYHALCERDRPAPGPA